VREHAAHLAEDVVDWRRGRGMRGRDTAGGGLDANTTGGRLDANTAWGGLDANTVGGGLGVEEEEEEVRKQGESQVRVVAEAGLAGQEELGAESVLASGLDGAGAL
jgi:hypothetical protein